MFRRSGRGSVTADIFKYDLDPTPAYTVNRYLKVFTGMVRSIAGGIILGEMSGYATRMILHNSVEHFYTITFPVIYSVDFSPGKKAGGKIRVTQSLLLYNRSRQGAFFH